MLSEEEIEEENERDEQNQVVRIRSLVPNSEQLEALQLKPGRNDIVFTVKNID